MMPRARRAMSSARAMPPIPGASRIASLVDLARSVASAVVIDTAAAARPGTSLMPSPTIATSLPLRTQFENVGEFRFRRHACG